MIRALASLFSWRYPAVLVYMLQSSEYHAASYLKWFWQTTHFERVMYRRTLEPTRAARMLLIAIRAGMLCEIAAGIVLIAFWQAGRMEGGLAFGIAVILAYPIVWAHLAVVPLELGRLCIIKPRQRRAIQASRVTFAHFKGAKIAVAGSYGKTSMKELLYMVLSEGKKVAATPANKNVSISHAYFARKLQGDEDIIIIEYGEGEPGDVARFADIIKPTHAVITGIAPAHLDQYGTLDAAARDIFSVGDHLSPDHVYVNGGSVEALPYIQPGQQVYDETRALGWHITHIHVGLDGTRFTMQKGVHKMTLQSGLLGRHQVGPLALAAALAREFGLTEEQIAAGIAKTQPFEHRMQPYRLGGAWIIDDTYNGNIEGIKAGAALLAELPARRRIYVTPGLVDQGKDTERIHRDMGEIIAVAKPDVVVLMEHSVTPFIRQGLEAGHFAGEVHIETDPLAFYTHLDLFVAAGDVVMMQNDWPDNYV